MTQRCCFAIFFKSELSSMGLDSCCEVLNGKAKSIASMKMSKTSKFCIWKD